MQALEREGKILVIRPGTPLDIGRVCHDPGKISRAYRRGREDTTEALKALRAWLEVPAAP